MGEVFRVNTDDGPHAVKELFAWNDGSGIEQEVTFTAMARSAGLAVPRELVTPAGELVVDVRGTRYRVYEWFDVLPPFACPVTPQVAGAMGHLVSTLHGLSHEVADDVDAWYRTPPDRQRLLALVDTVVERGADWSDGPQADLQPLLGLAEAACTVSEQPARICHRDLVPSNVLPLPDGRLAVLDWENVGPMWPEQEVGCLLVSWCTGQGAASPEAVSAFLAGYEETAEAPRAVTLEHFGVAVTVWLNFLVVQAEAALAVDDPSGQVVFAERSLRAMLQRPLSLDLLQQVVDAAQH